VRKRFERTIPSCSVEKKKTFLYCLGSPLCTPAGSIRNDEVMEMPTRGLVEKKEIK